MKDLSALFAFAVFDKREDQQQHDEQSDAHDKVFDIFHKPSID
ncbi:hypothetical protein [Nonlabens xiamenensis]|nr:hypothetical protein [Nonlabens xiamenensis]